MNLPGMMPRLLCVKTLIRAIETGSYGNLALNSALSRAEAEGKADAKDAALCTAIFQGTTERMITLDACIRAHVKRPLNKMELPVRCVLRCGIGLVFRFSYRRPEHQGGRSRGAADIPAF